MDRPYRVKILNMWISFEDYTAAYLPECKIFNKIAAESRWCEVLVTRFQILSPRN